MKAIASFMTMIVYANCLGCCDCTLEECVSGVWINITPLDGTVFPGGAYYTVKWRAGDESGELGWGDLSFKPDKLVFHIQSLSPPTEQIGIEFYDGVEQIGETETYPLKWEERLCNACSKASWCEKDYASSAVVEIGLDEAL